MPRCAYPPCNQPFEPKRITQRFCCPEHRQAFNHAHRRNDPHRCPYCTVMHDPEERAILDALELLIRDKARPEGQTGRFSIVWTQDLQAFIDRRRALLSAPETNAAVVPFPLAESAQMG